MDLDLLSEELSSDPLGRGYSSMSDQQAADDLNTAYRTIQLDSLSADVMRQQTDPAEWAALSQHKQTLWLSFIAGSPIDPWAGNNVQLVIDIWGGSSQTVSNLSSVRETTKTRAEELGLLGQSPEVGPAHVALARSL